MATTSAEQPKMFQYLCVLPDFEEGSKRMEVRPTHLENAKKAHADGSLITGGALLSGDAARQDGTAKMAGSFMIVNATSIEDAKERMAKDVYATGGAWDLSRAQYYSIVVAKH